MNTLSANLSAVKRSAKIGACLAGVLAICWMAGFIEFTYPNIVPNEPLLHPQKVRELNGTNIVLESGQIYGLSPWLSGDGTPEEWSSAFRNELKRSGFEVDVEDKQGNRVEVYVRWPRKFRDSAPPFTIPLIWQTTGKYYRKPMAFGVPLGDETKLNRIASGFQALSSDSNGPLSAANAARSKGNPISTNEMSERELLSIWSAPQGSVRKRADAVRHYFTNGTPISQVVKVLGANYGILRPYSSVWVGPGPEPRKTCGLIYTFGDQTVEIATSADISGDPLTGEFTGAGYSILVNSVK